MIGKESNERKALGKGANQKREELPPLARLCGSPRRT